MVPIAATFFAWFFPVIVVSIFLYLARSRREQ